jgi:hypothetical protein
MTYAPTCVNLRQSDPQQHMPLVLPNAVKISHKQIDGIALAYSLYSVVLVSIDR